MRDINSLPSGFGRLRQAPVTRLCRYNFARAGTLVRHLSVPNPIPYVGLAMAIETAWPHIQALNAKSLFSASQPVPSLVRAFEPQCAHSDLPEQRTRHWRVARHVLRTDIAMCYESLYTHTIPWAAHGKSVAKLNRNASPRYWGNSLRQMGPEVPGWANAGSSYWPGCFSSDLGDRPVCQRCGTPEYAGKLKRL